MSNTTTISFDFPDYKLKAIAQALRNKQNPKSVQTMLLEHVDEIYQKNVPLQARNYLDAQLGDPKQAALKLVTAPDKSLKQKKDAAQRGQNRSHGNPEMEQESDQSAMPEQTDPEQTDPEQEQEQEIAMSM